MAIREKIISGNIYHVLNRGVDKRKLFLDGEDHQRFVHDLFEFNDCDLISNNSYKFQNKKERSSGVNQKIVKDPRKLLVDILAFCLMPNHYHLLIRPRFDDGLLKFVKRLNQGYSQYFNRKYERVGTLFQGRYKLVPIESENHFIHIPYYIHLNPLDFVEPKWRDGKVSNYKEAIKFLENYKWSSHLDYIGNKNFPSVTSREFLLEIFDGSEKYRKEINNWIKDLDISQIEDLILE